MSTLPASFFTDAHDSTVSKAALPRAFEWLFLAFVAALPLMQLGVRLPVGTVTVADSLFVGVLLAGVIAIVSGVMPVKVSPMYIWIFAYVGVAGISAALGDLPGKSAARFPIEIYMVILAVVGFYAAGSVQALRRAVIAWMIGAAATVTAGLFGVLLFYSGLQPPWRSVVIDGHGSLPPGNYPRVHGLFLNMNMCCDYLIVSFVLLLLCRKLGWIRVGVFVLLMIGVCITAAFTVSPGLGGFVLAAGIWFWRRDSESTIGRFYHHSASKWSRSLLLLACKIVFTVNFPQLREDLKRFALRV